MTSIWTHQREAVSTPWKWKGGNLSKACDKIECCNAYISAMFTADTDWYSPCHHLIFEHFHHPNKTLRAHLQSVSMIAFPNPWKPLVCFMALWIGQFWYFIWTESHIAWSFVSGFSHVIVSSILFSFYYLNNTPSHSYTMLSLIHWSLKGHLCHIRFLVIMSGATIKLLYKSYLSACFQILQGTHLGVELLGPMLTLYFFEELSNYFPFYNPTARHKGSNFSASSVTLVFLVLIIATPVGVNWYPIAVLIAFPRWLMILSIFSRAYWPFLYLLWRNAHCDPLLIF